MKGRFLVGLNVAILNEHNEAKIGKEENIVIFIIVFGKKDYRYLVFQVKAKLNILVENNLFILKHFDAENREENTNHIF